MRYKIQFIFEFKRKFLNQNFVLLECISFNLCCMMFLVTTKLNTFITYECGFEEAKNLILPLFGPIFIRFRKEFNFSPFSCY